jgi:hypothetical protein
MNQMCIDLPSNCTSNKISSEPKKTREQNQKLRASYFCKNSKQAMSKNKEINPDPIDSDIHLMDGRQSFNCQDG